LGVDMNSEMGQADQRSKRCCDCNCDCGQTLINTFGEIVHDKLAPIYGMFQAQQKQMERVENLLLSVVAIKYPELKRKVPMPHQIETIDEDDDQGETPKKRKRIYSPDVSNKINTTLEPLFEENWKISKEREREIGQKLADEIGVEVTEGITIVKSFWHRSRGNSKRLYTQLDDYRQGLEMILSLDLEKRQDALLRYKIESDDIIRSDVLEVSKLLDDMRKKGSGRTAVKGKKNLKKLPDQPIKTLKGRASVLSNHFYQIVQAKSFDIIPMEPSSPSQSHSLSSPASTPTQMPSLAISLDTPLAIALNGGLPLVS